MIQFLHQIHIPWHWLTIYGFISVIVILKALQQNKAPGILIPKQGNGTIYSLLQISETYNISKGLDRIQNTVCTGKRLYQSVHFQIFIYPQRIHSRRIKTVKKHIDYDQNVQFLILHAKRHIFIIILEFIT